jgi:hypothetical protein
MALEKARAMPHSRERTEALRRAGMLQNGVVAHGIIFAKEGRPAKTEFRRGLGYPVKTPIELT